MFEKLFGGKPEKLYSEQDVKDVIEIAGKIGDLFTKENVPFANGMAALLYTLVASINYMTDDKDKRREMVEEVLVPLFMKGVSMEGPRGKGMEALKEHMTKFVAKKGENWN